MLSLYVRKSISVDIEGHSQSYTVFGDTEDVQKYYILPEEPKFAVDDKGQPKFNLMWYYSSKNENGGVCTFTVALPIPKEDSAKKQIAAQLHNDTNAIGRAHNIYDMLEAIEKNEQDKAKNLQDVLGLDEKQVQCYKSQFNENQDWRHFLPPTNIELQPVPVTGGTVTVRGFGDPDAYQKWQNGNQKAPDFTGAYQTTPSNLGDNQAVVSFDLSDKGANLFWHAFGGPPFKSGNPPSGNQPINSVVAVTYTVEFEAMLPPAKVTVTLDAKTATKLITQDVTDKDKWGHSDTRTEVIGREFKKEAKKAIKVEIPSTAYEAQDKTGKEAKEQQYGVDLEQWGANQLAQMVKDQLPNVSWDDLKDGRMKEEVLSKETRMFQLSKAIPFTVYPQGQLDTISSQVDKDKLDQYFQAVNLDERPYYDIQVVINPPSKLSQLNVGTLAVSPTFGGKNLYDTKGEEVTTLLFNDSNTGQRILTGRFDVKDSNQKKEFNYSCQVNYTTNTPPYHFSDSQKQDYSLSLVSGSSLGVVSAKLIGSGILWDIFSRGELNVKCGNIEKKYFLSSTSPNVDLLLTTGKIVTSTIQYQLKLDFKEGGGSISYPLLSNQWANADISQGSATLQTPYDNSKTYQIICPGIDESKVNMCIVNATYTLTFPGNIVRKINNSIILKKNQSMKTWTVPTTDLENCGVPGTLSYEATLIMKDDPSQQKNGNDNHGKNKTIIIE